MIADTLNNIGLYRGIHPNLDTAIRFLLSTDIAALADGRHDIDGDRVFINIMSPEFKPENGWEAHRRYADIQIALQEGESIEWLPLERVDAWEDYIPERDIQLSRSAASGMRHTLRPLDFGLYFPRDAHKPGLGHTKGRKAVVKVRID